MNQKIDKRIGKRILQSVILIGLLIVGGVLASASGLASSGNGNGNIDPVTVSSINAPTKPVQEQTIEQIIANKKAKDHPTPINDRIGKLSKDLSDRLAKVKPTDKVRVAIWVDDTGIEPVPRSDINQSNQSNQSNQPNANININVNANANANSHTTISDKEKPLKDYLNASSLTIEYASTYAPVVFAEVAKADIQGLVARNDVTLMQSEQQNQAMIYSSVPSVLAPPVWNYVSGGVKVAVVEPDGIDFANPNLKPGTYWIPSNPNIWTPFSHATAVAGIIASTGYTNPTYIGIAYKGPALLSANSQTFYDSDLMAASDWAMRNGARILSNSWGAPYTCGSFAYSPLTYYYDYIVKYYAETVVFSAGNGGQNSYPCNAVTAPALAYNVLSIGSYDDWSTGWQWSDDVVSTFSSYGAVSPHGDRILPNVVAVGAHSSQPGWNWGLTSTITGSPWIGMVGMGTSYSAPEVSGEASLLMYTRPYLGSWPEGVRAIIMASADHNIEGNSRLSNKDGAGGIDVLQGYYVANGPYLSVGYIDTNSFPWYSSSFYARQGDKVRTVFTWDSKSTGYTGTDVLDADLDLFIQRWDTTTSSWVYEDKAGSSASWDNNYEIVEFNAPQTGSYRAIVQKYRWDDSGAYNYFGYATYIH